ncbi:YciI family protein [Pseudonocardia eucalypti]|uniref:YciI family protein n=1 Tax=Pseudonocardia eucalypti TaxID=648755 RepID=A0ABP9QQP9_9PSEU|nr:hypothetical protein [Pseudonocardia eucalypti]
MPQYVVLIYERMTPNWPDDVPPEVMAANETVDAEMVERGGRILAGIALQPPDTATAVRGDLVTDGPFIETKEALAGVTVIEARDLDHALELAKLTPVANGGVEVRPLLGIQLGDTS